jgi:hypothetical protein
MSGHLSGEQISAWVLGEPGAEARRHASGCAECAAELARMERALAHFRGSVRGWGAGREIAAPLAVEQPRSVLWSGVRWAAAAALLLAASLLLDVHPRQIPARAALAQSDVQLLEQVDSEVSRAVPEPMEPLLQLLADGSRGRVEVEQKKNETPIQIQK